MGRIGLQILAAAVLLSGTIGAAAGQKGPLLRLSSREVDFGRVEQHQQLRDEIMMRNEGDAPLRILKIVPDCGCAAGAPSDSVIMPGQEVSLGIAFSTRTYKGPQNRRITLETNDPAEPKVVVRVLADVRPHVRLDRERLQFPAVRLGETPAQSVVVTADKGLGFKIVSVKGGEGILEWSARSVARPEEDAFELALKIRPDAPAGSFRKQLKIETEGPPVPGAELVVTGTITSYFQVEGGTRIRFPTVDAGQTDQVSVRITSDGSKPFRLLGVDSSVPFLAGQIAPAGEGSHTLAITLKETAPAGPFRQTLTVKTTDPMQESIEIEVIGRVRN